jgi:hypothetical protein
MTTHEDLCPDDTVCYEGDGWLCDLVNEVRLHTLQLALATVDKGGRAATQLQALLAEHDTQTGDAA